MKKLKLLLGILFITISASFFNNHYTFAIDLIPEACDWREGEICEPLMYDWDECSLGYVRSDPPKSCSDGYSTCCIPVACPEDSVCTETSMCPADQRRGGVPGCLPPTFICCDLQAYTYCSVDDCFQGSCPHGEVPVDNSVCPSPGYICCEPLPPCTETEGQVCRQYSCNEGEYEGYGSCPGFDTWCCSANPPPDLPDYCEQTQCTLEGQRGYVCGCGEAGCPVTAICENSKCVDHSHDICDGMDPYANEYSGPTFTLQELINLIYGILLPVAVGLGIYFIIKAGYTIKTSEGDPARKKQGFEELLAAITGTAFVGISFTILKIIITQIVQG